MTVCCSVRSRSVALFCVVLFVLPLSLASADEEASVSQLPELADAAEQADWDAVKRLIADGCDLNATQPDGMTALHWAARHGNGRVVRQLIDAKADLNPTTEYGITPLHIGCSLDKGLVTCLLLGGGADANLEQTGGVTPLMLAAKAGTPASILRLLRHGANVEARERKGQTALMWAAAAGNAEAIKWLIEKGADVNATTGVGFTAMMFAARDGHLKAVQTLYEAGVDVNAIMKPKNSGGRTPRKGTSALTLAVESGHFELAMYLIRSGADPNDQRSGFTPLHALTWVRKPDRGENSDGDPPPRGSGNLTSLQFVRELVDAGADVNVKLKSGKSGKAVLNRKGATPFLLAAKTADLPYMKLLVELGADPTITNADGCNALMAAAGVGVRAVGEEAGTEPEVIEAIDYLITLGVDLNAVDDNKETAMHGAAYRNFPRVVEYLASKGADSSVWNHKNRSGWTPVMIAQGKRPGSFKPSPTTVSALQAAM